MERNVSGLCISNPERVVGGVTSEIIRQGGRSDVCSGRSEHALMFPRPASSPTPPPLGALSWTDRKTTTTTMTGRHLNAKRNHRGQI